MTDSSRSCYARLIQLFAREPLHGKTPPPNLEISKYVVFVQGIAQGLYTITQFF